VATVEECEAALEQVVGLLQGADESVRQHADDRTVSCFVPDLDTVFSARLHEGSIVDLTTDGHPKAQIRLTISSDDLVALVNGELAFPQAFAHGRVRIDASLRDLFRLRSLL
jgi:putative sterol carrier protein